MQPAPAAAAPALGRLPAILTLREQAEMYNAWLTVRLERLLPDLMRQEGFDMWIVICRENNEDPVFTSLVPFTTMYASRTSMLVFTDKGPEGIERLNVSRSGIGQFYKARGTRTAPTSGRASARSSRSAARRRSASTSRTCSTTATA